MKKAILLGASLMILAAGVSSCKKCYQCTLNSTVVGVNGRDSSITLKTELCNKGSQGAGTNLKGAVADIEANGYICKPE